MSERIALLADVHGNATALRAVLADAQARHATRYWFLGDLIMPGPGAEDLFTLLASVGTEVIINGNWEEAFFAALDGHIWADDPSDVYFVRLSEYLTEHLDDATIATMRKRPIAVTKHIAGLTIQLTHNLPDHAGGHTLYPNQPQKNYDALFADHRVDIAIFGHIHQQLMRYGSQGQLIINPGAVGQAYDPRAALSTDHRAQYALLDIADNGVNRVDMRRVSYDVEKELALAQAADLPYLDLYTKLRRTGRTFTHDDDLLAGINAAHGYRDDVIRFARQRHHAQH